MIASTVNSFASTLLLACIGFRVWLHFSKRREDYSFWFQFWRFAVMPAACLSFTAGQFTKLDSAGWFAIAVPVLPRLSSCSFYFFKGGARISSAASDVSEDSAFLKKLAEPFDPEKYIDLRKGIFVGFDGNRKPIFLPRQTIDKNHLRPLASLALARVLWPA